jgi:1-acyl-sn-glycerol-3-phosphate acyltransferase
LNRWNNGHVIVEMLPPVTVEEYKDKSVRDLSNQCYEAMKVKLEELDKEVAQLNAKK